MEAERQEKELLVWKRQLLDEEGRKKAELEEEQRRIEQELKLKEEEEQKLEEEEKQRKLEVSRPVICIL